VHQRGDSTFEESFVGAVHNAALSVPCGMAEIYACHRIEGINLISHNRAYWVGLSAIVFRLVKQRLIDNWALLWFGLRLSEFQSSNNFLRRSDGRHAIRAALSA
jgi:hypothetical protein